MPAAATPADRTESYFPLAGGDNDGWSNEEEATATCFCGAVQLKFVTNPGPGIIHIFVCNCADCRKVTASMFASNFSVVNTHLTHVRGRENLSTYAQARTIASSNTMTNFFCKTCGTLMYRCSSAFPELSVLRIGTVDDFSLHETKLKPMLEQFVERRVGWLHPVEGVEQVEGMWLPGK
ncbi:Mss4-like protein [Mycena olivaceomarginata]|nr:Mss4-like protein [Mycena olivaceomarginata]